MLLIIIYFSFLLWASMSAAIQPGLSSSNVLCFIDIVAIVSFEQTNYHKSIESNVQKEQKAKMHAKS